MKLIVLSYQYCTGNQFENQFCKCFHLKNISGVFITSVQNSMIILGFYWIVEERVEKHVFCRLCDLVLISHLLLVICTVSKITEMKK